jgi:hypothetical protein
MQERETSTAAAVSMVFMKLEFRDVTKLVVFNGLFGLLFETQVVRIQRLFSQRDCMVV